jgi:hypothetical protein
LATRIIKGTTLDAYKDLSELDLKLYIDYDFLGKNHKTLKNKILIHKAKQFMLTKTISRSAHLFSLQ